IVRQRRSYVGPDAARSLQQKRGQSDVEPLQVGYEIARPQARQPKVLSMWKADQKRSPFLRLARGCSCARGFDRLPDLGGAQFDLGAARLRAGDGEHQGRGVAKIPLIMDGTSALRQVSNGSEPSSNIIEDGADVFQVVIHREDDHGGVAARGGFNLGNLRVRSDDLLNGLRYQLFDLFGAGTGPRGLH